MLFPLPEMLFPLDFSPGPLPPLPDLGSNVTSFEAKAAPQSLCLSVSFLLFITSLHHHSPQETESCRGRAQQWLVPVSLVPGTGPGT